jgi:pyridoxine 5-phosphate synthase
MTEHKVQLGVDLDVIASLSGSERMAELDIISAASVARRAGADSIVIHVRSEAIGADILNLCKSKGNVCLKISPELSMLKAALKARPMAICFVSRNGARPGPIQISESSAKFLARAAVDAKKAGISVGISINPEAFSLRKAKSFGVDFVELCAAAYSRALGKKKVEEELEQLELAVYLAYELGLKAWVGCGLNYGNARPVSEIPHIDKVNVGFSIIAHAFLWGLKSAVYEMKTIIS